MINHTNLRKLRIQNRFSLQEMADALGLTTAGGYQRLETGENKLKAEHLPMLAQKFGIKLHQLTDELFTSDPQLDHPNTLQSPKNWKGNEEASRILNNANV